MLIDGGREELSEMGKQQVTLLSERLRKVFGSDRVVACKSFRLSGCVV
jgi:hypothetical protein